MTATETDSKRWLALYVLCGGMLMIVLDATIVNVALPTIQTRPRVLAVEPRLGGQRIPDRLRRPAVALRAARRPDRPAPRLPGGPGDLHARLAGVRDRADPGVAGGRPLRPGRRRRGRLGRDLGDDRDHVPRAPGAGQGNRRLRLRRLRRGLDRADRRRRDHPGDQLALDLRHQPAGRDRGRARCDQAGRGPRRHRPLRGRRHPGRGADHDRRDARRLHPARGREQGLRVGTDAGRRRDRDRAPGRPSSCVRRGSRTR